MQFYGLEKERLVLVTNAEKGTDYRCPECLGQLRVRGGPHRQIHFYHLKRPALCRQHEKTLEHLQTQLRIQSILSVGEGILEKSFTAIGRIADVAWEKNKIIFEIQCSPISLEEVHNRCRDYEKLGYKLVWILHDRRFNCRKMSAAENYLRSRLCYFTNIDERGDGIIYDQLEELRGSRRFFRGPPLRVDVASPILASEEKPFHFLGDLIDRAQKLPSGKPKKKVLGLRGLYKIFLHSALESLCATPK